MNFKTTYVLFGILAVVLGVFVYTLFVGPGQSDSGAWVLPSAHNEASPLPDKDIDRVEIERHRPDEQKIVLVRENDNWKVVEPRDYRADRFAVEDLVRQVLNARPEKRADVANNPGQYGLSPPAAVITLKKEADPKRQVTLNVGDVSPGEQSAVVYVTSSDKKEVMAVAKRDLGRAQGTLADFRARDLLTPASGDIQAFTLTEQNKDKVTRGPLELKKGSEDRWAYVRPPYGDAQATGTDPAATDKAPGNVQSVLGDLSNLRVENSKDFVADDVKDLSKYHLDPAKDDVLRVEIERVEEISKDSEGNKEKKTAKVALLVGVGKKVEDKDEKKDEKKGEAKKEEKQEYYYACLDDPKHKDVVRIPVKKVERLVKLLEKPDALRDRNLVELRGQADALDVKNSWGTLEFRRTSDAQKPWKLWRGDTSYAVDEQTIQALITALTQPNQVKGFEDDPAMRGKRGLDKPDATVSIWADSLPKDTDRKKDDKDKKDAKPEPKDKNKPAFVLAFGARTGDDVAVERRRGDEKTGTVVLVPAKLLDQVREGPLAYLDRELPPFGASRFDALTDVTKLALTREGTTYEIGRENKPDAAWKIEKPSDFAGRTADRRAVEDILRDLNTLRAVKIVEDKLPADAKLAEYGLKDPRVKAVVTQTKDGKAKTFEYDFGKEAEDKSGVYLRAGQQDMVALVPNAVLSGLQRELQDPTVFQFDTAKVKEVKLTGWMNLARDAGLKKPYVLDVKRGKDGGWEVQNAEGFDLDAGKLQNFLRELSALKATKFVAHKSKPTAEQELDVDKGALQIDVTLEGEKEPIQLTVGKEEGGAYLAVSNKLPGDIFTVRKDLFEGAKKARSHFAKQ